MKRLNERAKELAGIISEADFWKGPGQDRGGMSKLEKVADDIHKMHRDASVIIQFQ